MKQLILPLLFFFVPNYFVSAQESKAPKATIEYISDELLDLIHKNAKVEVIAEGFEFTEGPLWVEDGKMLLFSDVPANTIYKWAESEGKSVYLKPGGYTDTAERGGFMGPNGLALSHNGKLWISQHGDRRIAEMNAPLDSPAPNYQTVADSYDGKKLNSPNDLIISTSGNLYFTDPSYGFEMGPSDPKKEIEFQGVYKMDPKGKVTLLLDSINQPNGIGLMPDQKTLIVSNSDPEIKRWYSYQLDSDGSITSGKVFHDASSDPDAGLCDGFKIDKKGNVFASGPGGIWVFNCTGSLLGKIKLEGATAANCALSPDGKTLYITAEGFILRSKMR